MSFEIELFIRLLVATILGGIIGFEREINNRPAGFRTHILVTLGSCLIMILSIYGFMDESNNYQGDPARLAAQVVSGIGFLGAGTILREGANVKGLTTAASLWLSGGIGLAVGLGFYWLSIFAVILALISLIPLSRMEKRIFIKNKIVELKIKGKNRSGLLGDVGVLLGKYNINIKNISVNNSDLNNDQDIIEIFFYIKEPIKYNKKIFKSELLNIDGIQEIFWNDSKLHL